MNGRLFLFDLRDPLGLSRARRNAWDFRRDSIRELHVHRALRAMSWDELYAALSAGWARIDAKDGRGYLVPVAQGGGCEGLYSVLPSSSNAPSTIATATSRKTLIQVATPSTTDIDVVQWSCFFDASAAAQPIVVDLTEVDVAATVTSYTPQKWIDPNMPASLCPGGTSATGTAASAEGTITASRLFDSVMPPPTSGILVQYPLGREPKVAVSKFLRLRALGFTSDTPNALPSVIWRE